MKQNHAGHSRSCQRRHGGRSHSMRLTIVLTEEVMVVRARTVIVDAVSPSSGSYHSGVHNRSRGPGHRTT